MRKIMLFAILCLFLFVTACGDDSTVSSTESNEKASQDSNKTSDKVKGKIKSEDFDKIYSDPKKYKGFEVEFIGQVFVEPERDEDGIYLQMNADPENHEKNTIVGIEGQDFEVSTEDYVKVTGVIQDEFQGENAFGAELNIPVVMANDAKVVDYVTAVSPTVETIEVDEEQNQHGYVVHVEKLEIAENMTRVYISINNNTEDTISFYSFETKLVLDNKQMEEDQSFFDTGLPELQAEILPGVESDGVVIFPPIDPDTAELTLHVEGSSDNFELDFEPFKFKIDQE